jgi:ABC-type antimicrobial peptide transport system permease subunit
MLRNIKITIRNLKRSGVYSFVNIAGLAISLATCVFIVLWVQDERSYDRFHKDAESIYLTTTHFNIEGNYMSAPISPGAIAPSAKENFGTVEDYCRVRGWNTGFVLYEDIKTSSISCFYSDPNFFDFFNFPLLKGNKSNPLQNPNDVVINERLAMQLFGKEDPVGKVASLDNGRQIHVTAVMKNLPKNTYLQDVDLVSTFAIDTASYYSRVLNSWDGAEFFSYLRLRKGTDVVQLAEQVAENQMTAFKGIRSFRLQPLVNMHLYNIEGESVGLKTVQMFQWIGLVILVIACINYVNLLTARASRRHREIGMKKIVGARKFGLFMELIGEAIIMFVFAILIAVVLNLCLLEVFNAISGKEFTFSLFDARLWLTYLAMLVAVVVLAGIYPAYMLSSYKTNIMQSVRTKTGNSFFRKILVVLQFTASTALIAGTLVLGLQMKYIREKDMGYDRENVLSVNMINIREHYNAVKAELEQQTSILGVTAASENIMDVGSGNAFNNWEGKTSEGMTLHQQIRVDTSYINVMHLTLVDGDGFTSLSTTERQYILNEAAIKTMGMTDPVGKWVDRPEWKIVGVVKDFHFASLHSEIGPLVMFYEPRFIGTLFVRTAPGKVQDAMAAIEKVWQQYNAEYAFNYTFLDETFDRIYKSDILTGKLFSIFSIIAVLISCLGLFGLVVFTAELKTKEIGIRKVLGASIMNIIKFLVKDFLVLIGISILIAMPLAYYWLNAMLQDYVYRISLSWWMFAAAALITVALTVLTVGRMAFKAATKNPVDAIKAE